MLAPLSTDTLPALSPTFEAELRARYGERADEMVAMHQGVIADRAAAIERGEALPEPTGPQEEDATFVEV